MPVSTDKDRVRLLISDVGGTSGDDFIFSDDEIDAFLEMRTSVFGAAATALRTIAANEAMVSKRITFLELATDGPAVAKALREAAADLDAQADSDESDDAVFEIVQMGSVDSFGRRELRGIET